MSLHDRVALVTGAGRGIGRAIADRLADGGCRVVVADVDGASAEQAAAEIGVAYETETLGVGANVADATSVKQMVEAAVAAFGSVDILVNNAGIIHRGDSTDMAFADWRRVLSVNLDSVWLLSQAAGRRMVAQGAGKIVIVSSVLGTQGGLRVPAYAASKHAVIGLTRALCNEWAAHGVNVNAIAPGYTATDNTQALRDDPERSRALLARIPAGRFAEPSEIAGAAVFLSSDAAAYCHGSVVTVDGGWLAR